MMNSTQFLQHGDMSASPAYQARYEAEVAASQAEVSDEQRAAAQEAEYLEFLERRLVAHRARKTQLKEGLEKLLAHCVELEAFAADLKNANTANDSKERLDAMYENCMTAADARRLAESLYIAAGSSVGEGE